MTGKVSQRAKYDGSNGLIHRRMSIYTHIHTDQCSMPCSTREPHIVFTFTLYSLC